MRIIKKAALRDFWRSRKTDSEIAERDLIGWHKVAVKAWSANWGELEQTFGTADQVGDCVVFNVGHNRFRLIGRVRYAGRGSKIYVLKIMDHQEYERKLWVGQCGCHMPPPKSQRPATGTKPARRGNIARRRQKGGT